MTDAKERYQRLQEFFSSKISKGSLLFPELKTLDLANKDDNYLNRMALGGIVALLSYRQVENEKFHPINENGEIDDNSPYLSDFSNTWTSYDLLGIHDKFRELREPDDICRSSRNGKYDIWYTPHYPLTWIQLCGRTNKFSSKTGIYIDSSEELSHVLDSKYIENFGNLVLQGDLPLDTSILRKAFENVSEDLNKLAELINQKGYYPCFYKMNSTFLIAIEESAKNTKPDGNKFRSLLNILRIEALHYSCVDDGIILAKNVLEISKKVGAMNLTQEDVDTFMRQVKEHSKCCWKSIDDHANKITLGFILFWMFSALVSMIILMLTVILGSTVLKFSIPVLFLIQGLTLQIPLMMMVFALLGGVLAGFAFRIWCIWGKQKTIDLIEANLSQMSKRTEIDSNVLDFPSILNREQEYQRLNP